MPTILSSVANSANDLIFPLMLFVKQHIFTHEAL